MNTIHPEYKQAQWNLRRQCEWISALSNYWQRSKMQPLEAGEVGSGGFDDMLKEDAEKLRPLEKTMTNEECNC